MSVMVNHHKEYDEREETLTSNPVALNPIKNELSRSINTRSRIFKYQENGCRYLIFRSRSRIFKQQLTSAQWSGHGVIGRNAPASLARLQRDPARDRTRNAGDAWRVDIGRPAVARRMKMLIAAGQ